MTQIIISSTKAAWQSCGQEGLAPKAFEDRLREVLEYYTPDAKKMPRTSNQKRKAQFAKIQTLSKKLLIELDSLPDDLEYEIHDAYLLNEPEDFMEKTMGTVDEGLDFFEYEYDYLNSILSKMTELIAESLVRTSRPAGRPIQNENLEETIRKLAKLFEKTTGKDPRKGISVSAYSNGSNYGGPFNDFVQATVWTYNGKDFPKSAALGETIRVALGLRNKRR